MAKAIDNATATLISDIQSGDTPANQILATEAVGLSEKQEFVTLLENYRVRTTAADIRVAEAASARTRQQASVSSSSTGDID